MKILNFANVIGKERGGGVHEVAYNFWGFQNQLNIESHLWFPGTEDEKNGLIDNQVSPEYLRALDTYLNPSLGLVKNSTRLLKELSTFDIIHQHGIWLPISYLTKKSYSKNKVATIIQPHGYLKSYSLGLSKNKKKIAYYLFEKHNLELCKVLVACSNEERDELRWFFPNKDIAVIPNGVTQIFVQQKSNTNYFSKKKFKGKRNLLFLSRIHPSKGLNRLIQIFSELDKKIIKIWNLVIAGVGEDNYINELKHLAIKLKVSDSVFFEGPKFGQEKVDILSSADVFILPTFTENFGIVVAESLSRGTPVITTEGAPWSILEENKCGFWVKNTNIGISEGLKHALQLPHSELALMGEKGKILIKRNFIWENIIQKTIVLYKWVIEGGDVPEFVSKGNRALLNKKIC